jgi:hypothetical protein
MPPEQNALESAIDAMMIDGNPEDVSNETEHASDANSASQEAGAGAQAEGDTVDASRGNAQSGADGDADAGGEGQAGRPKPQIYDQHLPSDKYGNLVDPSGRIVARAGNERAYYEAARNAMRRTREAGSELDRMDAEIRAYREAATAPDRFKLSPTEAIAGMEWASLYKSNPEQAVKELLADAAARGISIPGLGIDTAAMQKMIKDSVAPFVADREAVVQQEQAMKEGQREWESLTQEFSWLPQHEAAFANLLQQHPQMTPMQIALRIEREANARGIDLYNPQRQEPQRINRATTPAQTTSGSMTPQAPVREAPVTGNSTRDRIRALMKQHNFSMER